MWVRQTRSPRVLGQCCKQRCPLHPGTCHPRLPTWLPSAPPFPVVGSQRTHAPGLQRAPPAQRRLVAVAPEVSWWRPVAPAALSQSPALAWRSQPVCAMPSGVRGPAATRSRPPHVMHQLCALPQLALQAHVSRTACTPHLVATCMNSSKPSSMCLVPHWTRSPLACSSKLLSGTLPSPCHAQVPSTTCTFGPAPQIPMHSSPFPSSTAPPRSAPPPSSPPLNISCTHSGR